VVAPRLAVVPMVRWLLEGARRLWPTTRSKRCWCTDANGLNKLPRATAQSQRVICGRSGWPRRGGRRCAASRRFNAAYQAEIRTAWPSAWQRIARPAAFYISLPNTGHLRTSNPSKHLCHRAAKPPIPLEGSCRIRRRLAMVFKLVDAAQKSWRRLDGHNHLPSSFKVSGSPGIEVAANRRSPKPKPPPPEPSAITKISAIAFSPECSTITETTCSILYRSVPDTLSPFGGFFPARHLGVVLRTCLIRPQNRFL